ncbi:translocation/assembly module TamB domain-containing protein [Vibrio sp. 10N.261.55.A7]|uniref:autotransporter assembly complex protein TamB n=1 Tax=Vibrio sp. 10N.261.55.A7 TaxID=1880851 RepID=UPI000C814989|nr:translocation/assembly module TamB domain-containing protein [Vibrio sp. 10N.261.55.A7]PMJ99698.1 hypothetical protein BCU12_20735 [Vibrio sp. 10N.261.55.A7]
MINVVFKWTKWLSAGLISLVVLIMALVIGLLYTNAGLNMALWGAQKALPQLQVESTQGAIFPRFTLHNLSFKDEDLFIDVVANSITLAVNPSCFLEPSICINDLAADGLTFSMPQLPESEEAATPTKPETKPLKISTPIPITVRQIRLSNIDLDILGNKIQWQSLNSGIRFQNNQLRLMPTLWRESSLTLASSNTPDDTTGSNEDSAASSSENKTTQEPIQLPSFSMPLSLIVERFDVQEFKLEQASHIIVNHLGFEAEAKGSLIDIQALELTMPEVEADLVADVKLVGDYPLNAELSARVTHAQANGQMLSLSAAGSVADLSIKSRLSGLVEAEIDGQLKPLEPTFPYQVVIKDARAQWPLSGTADYKVAVESLSSSGSLESYHIKLDSDIQGTSFPDLSIELEGKGNVEQIDITELALATLGGTIRGQVFANWSAPINWSGKLNLDQIQPGLYWPEAEGNISGDIETAGSLTEAGGWATNTSVIDIDGILRDYPLNVSGSIVASDEQGEGEFYIQTPGLVLAHGPNSVKAEGELSQNWDMNLNLALSDLSKSVPEVAGVVVGDVSLKGKLSEPQIRLELTGRDLDWRDEASIQNVMISGDVLPLPDVNANLTLQATSIIYQENSVDSVELKLKGSLDEHSLALDVISDIASTSLAISGSLQQKPALDWAGSLERLLLESQQGQWNLDQPTKVSVDVNEQSAFVEAHCWLQDSSSICLDQDTMVGEAGEAQLSINQFNFDQLAAFIPEGTEVGGEVNAQAKAKWAPNSKPEVTVALTIPSGQVSTMPEAPLVVGWDAIKLDATLANDRLEASWLLDVADNGELSGDIMLPSVYQLESGMQGNVRISEIGLAFLSPLIGEFSRFDALVNSQLSLSGDLKKPDVTGDLRIDNLLLLGEVSPIDINSGQVVTQFSGTKANLQASITTPDGPLNIEGDADWADLEKWSSNIRVFAKELLISQPPMLKVKVTPDMTINLAPDLAKISGSIDLPWGQIVVEELPPNAIGISKDQILLDQYLEPIDDASNRVFALETDVKITIGDEFTLSAFGLEGNLVGQLNVSQRDKGPIILGEINIVDGSYRSFGQDLIIDEGKILMNGPVDQPYVSINAIRNPDNTRDDVVAGVRVDGPADEPTITIYSEPSMPQANALSYLLRGQDIDAETGGNAMTTTLIGLSLAKSGKVVGEIGEAFGVQDLQLDTAGSGDESQVTVSGYVLPGLQVKYGVGIFDSVAEFTVRYRLMTDLYVEVLSGVDNAVDLLYQFEFE